MISSPASTSRQIIPRWRTLDRTIASRELASPAARGARFQPTVLAAELLHKLERWRFEQGVVSSAELVETALVHGHDSEALNAARMLLRGWSGATRMVLKQAAYLLAQSGHSNDVVDQTLLKRACISSCRPREGLTLNPRDALAWVELALAQTSCGHLDHAQRTMSVALQLAPHNRHVLRSAARLHVQMHDPERAHALVRRAPNIATDPWLMAAEIAIASKLERAPLFTKKGFALLDGGRHLPRQVSELAAALASEDLDSGSHKRARKLFRESLMDPTGNSLAQAEWASYRAGESFVGQGKLANFVDASEAKATHAFGEGEFEIVLDLARTWIKEEPYSARAHFVGAAAANALDNYAEAAKFACEGLRRDPKSTLLRNSFVFSLASANRLGEAEKALKALPQTADQNEAGLVAEANRGLIAFRRGDFAAGELHYRNAISGFRKQQRRASERIALAYFAREAAIAARPDAEKLLKEAEALHPTHSTPQIVRALAGARNALAKGAVATDASEPAGRLTPAEQSK